MDETKVYEMLGAKIRDLRDRAGMTQSQLAANIGVKQGFIGSVERGGKVSLHRLYQILDALGYDLSFVVAGVMSHRNDR